MKPQNRCAGSLFSILLANALLAQTTKPEKFDIAHVQSSAPATNPDTFVSGGLLQSGRYDLRRATILDLIGIAWSIDTDKIVGGPDWVNFDRFDISAKAPAGTSPETAKLMLQWLLKDRFELALHNDTRPFPAFALTTGGKKAKLRETDPALSTSAVSGCQIKPESRGAVTTVYACRNIAMAAFAPSLQRIAGDYLRAGVVDATGMTGSWDFDIQWNPRSRVLSAGEERVTIFQALENQLGLKLELRPVPTPVLVIDRLDRKPAANDREVSQTLPPRSLEFEVATIKLSNQDERFGFRRYPGGRIELHAFPMKMLIATAWDVDWDHMDERIGGAPKWIDTKRFDVVANASSDHAVPQGSGFMDGDFQLMLRALLAERFKIASHFEDRPVTAYALTAVKPKLAKAEPSNRSACREARIMPQDPRDRNPLLSRLMECHNVTMAQFAAQLTSMDRVEAAFNKVVDETNLKGAYDFSISFTPRARMQDAKGASDPNGAVSFMEAIGRQLGLKLEARKLPMPVLIIDHLEEMPEEN